MVTKAEGLTPLNSLWNVLHFTVNVLRSVECLVTDFKTDTQRMIQRRVDSESFGSSVMAGFESLYVGDFPDTEFEDDDEYEYVESEDDE